MPPSPLSLTDQQMASVLLAARSLPYAARSEFLRCVAYCMSTVGTPGTLALERCTGLAMHWVSHEDEAA
jgi:hypothetical protein